MIRPWGCCSYRLYRVTNHSNYTPRQLKVYCLLGDPCWPGFARLHVFMGLGLKNAGIPRITPRSIVIMSLIDPELLAEGFRMPYITLNLYSRESISTSVNAVQAPLSCRRLALFFHWLAFERVSIYKTDDKGLVCKARISKHRAYTADLSRVTCLCNRVEICCIVETRKACVAVS